MASLDRGGLRYEVLVVVRNIRQLRNFRAELEKTARVTRRVSQEQVRTSKALASIQIQEQRARKERERANEAAAKARLAEQRVRSERGRTIAQLRRAVIAETQLAAARERAARAANTARRGNNRLTSSLRRTEQAANRVSFTFRRLFGIFAAFQAARELANGLRLIVLEGTRFNAFVEEARLGIQALLAATGQVFGPDGVALQGLQKFNAISDEARGQLEKLRIDARNTAATFQTLLETFQIGLAPGLAAGLSPDQIRRLTISISQAATAVGLPQNQLAEEIRSLLSGTIQPRTTRIATSLGITNEDIRLARQAGRLSEFLTQKFEAFNTASQDALGNLTVLLTNARDDLARLLGVQTEPFFEELKAGIAAFRAELDSGEDAAAFAEALNEALLQTLDIFEEFAGGVGFESLAELISALTEGLGEALEAIASLSAGFVRGLADALSIIGRITAVLGRVANFFSGSLGTLLQWVVTFRIVRSLLGSITGAAFAVGQAMGRAAVQAQAFQLSARSVGANLGTAAIAGSRLGRVIGIAGRGLRLVAGFAARLTGLGAIILTGWQIISSLFSETADEAEKVNEEIEFTANAADRIALQFAGASTEIASATKRLTELRREAERIEGAFDIATATRSLGDLGADVVRILLEGSQAVQRETISLDEERQRRLKEIANAQARLVANEAQILALNRAGNTQLVEFEDRLEAQLEVERRINALIAGRRRLETQAAQIREGARQEELQGQIQAANERIAKEQEIARAIARRRQEDITQATGGDDTQARALNSAIEERVALQERLNALRTQERSTLNAALDLEREIARATDARLGTFLVQQNQRLEAQNELLRRQIEDRREIARLALSGVDERVVSLQRERKEVLAQAEIQRERNKLVIEELRERSKTAQDNRVRAEIQEAINNLLQRNVLLRRAAVREAADLQREQQRIERSARTVANLNPASTILRLTPDIIPNLARADNLLKNVSETISRFEVAAVESRLRSVFGESVEGILRLRQTLQQAEEDQRSFNDQADALLTRTQDRLRKLSDSESTAILKATQDLTKDQGQRVADAVEVALRDSAAGDRIFRGLDSELLKAARSAFGDILKSREQVAALEAEIAQIERNRTLGNERLKNLTESRVALLNEELALQQQISGQQAASNLALSAADFSSRVLDENETETRRRRLETERLVERAALESLRSQQEVRLQLAQRAVDEARGMERTQLEEALTRLKEEQSLALAQQVLSVATIEESLSRISDGDFFSGITEGVRQFTAQVDLYQLAVTETQSLIAGFADLVAASLFDAESFFDNFINLLQQTLTNVISGILQQGIAELLSQFLGQQSASAAIVGASTASASILTAGGVSAGEALIAGAITAAAILSSAGFFAGGAADGGLIGGFAKGGQIPHANADGYASGGRIRFARPRGLDPSDTVPIWAAPGEFMQPVNAVRYYGSDIMEGLRSMRIDRDMLRSLMTGTKLPQPRRAPGAGFATGGEIPARGSPRGGAAAEVTIKIESEGIVADGLSSENVRAVSPGIKEPRTLAEIKRSR